MEPRNLPIWPVAIQMVQPFWKVVLGHSHKRSISSDPVIPLLGLQPQETIQDLKRKINKERKKTQTQTQTTICMKLILQ